jgi:hypothetical protein
VPVPRSEPVCQPRDRAAEVVTCDAGPKPSPSRSRLPGQLRRARDGAACFAVGERRILAPRLGGPRRRGPAAEDGVSDGVPHLRSRPHAPCGLFARGRRDPARCLGRDTDRRGGAPRYDRCSRRCTTQPGSGRRRGRGWSGGRAPGGARRSSLPFPTRGRATGQSNDAGGDQKEPAGKHDHPRHAGPPVQPRRFRLPVVRSASRRSRRQGRAARRRGVARHQPLWTRPDMTGSHPVSTAAIGRRVPAGLLSG